MRRPGNNSRRPRTESLERRMLLAADVGHNPEMPEDVSGNGQVTPQDALIVINNMASPSSTPLMLDVNADGESNALDALNILNFLNSGGEGGSRVRIEARIARLTEALESGNLPGNLTTERAQEILSTLEAGGLPELGDRIRDGILQRFEEMSIGERVESRLIRAGVEADRIDTIVESVRTAIVDLETNARDLLRELVDSAGIAVASISEELALLAEGEDFGPAADPSDEPLDPETDEPLDPETDEPLDPETDEPLNPETDEPLNPETDEPLNPETDEPLNPETDEPLNPETDEPLNPETDEPLNPETDEPLNPETDEPLDPETDEPLNSETDEPLDPETDEPLDPETDEPLDPETDEPLDPETDEPDHCPDLGHGRHTQRHPVDSADFAERLAELGIDQTVIDTVIAEIDAGIAADEPLTRSQIRGRLEELGVDLTELKGTRYGSGMLNTDRLSDRLISLGADAESTQSLIDDIVAGFDANQPLDREMILERIEELGIDIDDLRDSRVKAKLSRFAGGRQRFFARF